MQRLPQDVVDPKLKRVSRNEVGARPFIEPDPEDPDTQVYVKREPPLQVNCDHEGTTNAEGNQMPILLCAETEEEEKWRQNACGQPSSGRFRSRRSYLSSTHRVQILRMFRAWLLQLISHPLQQISHLP